MPMPKQQIHPSVEDLTAFSVGQLSSGDAATVECHISTCDPCSETLMGLSSEDTFVALLKEANAPIDSAATEVTERELTAGDDTMGNRQSALTQHPRYEIVGLIAKGGMGDVFKAEHRMMERTVARKVIDRELMRNPEAVERFHREVKTAAHLSHPNIVTAYDAEQADDIHFLVMEHVDGVNLAELVKHGDRLSVAAACEYARQASVGLQYAHERGMVHRDIKPHNLMLTSDGTIKILDFGLASLAEKSLSSQQAVLPEHPDLTVAGAIMGTPDFISPEQAADAHQADIRSDIYSLGATLHYLLSGQPPFAEGSVAEKLRSHSDTQPVSISSLRDDVPEGLSDIIHRMLSKDPDQRFQTPQEVADALAPFFEKHKTKIPVNSLEDKRGGNSWWPPTRFKLLACAAFGFILAGIIYVETDKGTLVIESDDETVKVTISKATDDVGDTYIQTDFVDNVTGTSVTCTSWASSTPVRNRSDGSSHKPRWSSLRLLSVKAQKHLKKSIRNCRILQPSPLKTVLPTKHGNMRISC
ncbi:MAG: serine/threonine-protein kinase [Fuerstiella sp.]